MIDQLAETTADGVLLLIQEFVAQRFSDNLRLRWETSLGGELPDIETELFVPQTQGMERSVAGAAMVVGGRVSGIVLRRLGQRMPASVVGKLIPFIGWGLLAVDAITLWGGAFGTIEKNLRNDLPETLQQSYTRAVEKIVREQAGPAAEITASRMYDLWLRFEKDWVVLMDLIEAEPRMKALVATIGSSELPALATLAGHLQGTEPDLGLLREALLLPRESHVMLERGQTLTDLIGWSRLAGDDLMTVVHHEIYLQKPVASFRRHTLNTLIRLDDAHLVAKLTTLPDDEMNALLENLPAAGLVALSDVRPGALQRVAEVALSRDRETLQILVRRLGERPELSDRLDDAAIGRLLANSSNPERVIDFLERPNGSLEMFGDSLSVLAGGIPARAYLVKHGIERALVAALFLTLMLGIPLLILGKKIRAVF